MTVQGGWDAGELARCFAFGRRCAAGARHQRSGAGLSQPAGQDDHRVLAGGRDRRARPPDRRQAQHRCGASRSWSRTAPAAAATSARPPRRQAAPTATRCISARRRSAPTSRSRRPPRSIRSPASSRSCWSAPRWKSSWWRTQTPFNSVKEVVDYAKANPGKLNYASVGIGTSAHLATVLFSDVVGDQDAARALQPDVAVLRRHVLRPHRDLVHHRGRLAAAYQAPARCARLRSTARRARSSCPSCRP